MVLLFCVLTPGKVHNLSLVKDVFQGEILLCDLRSQLVNIAVQVNWLGNHNLYELVNFSFNYRNKLVAGL